MGRRSAADLESQERGDYCESIGEFVDLATRICDGWHPSDMCLLCDGWGPRACDLLHRVANGETGIADEARKLLALPDRYQGVDVGAIDGEALDDDDDLIADVEDQTELYRLDADAAGLVGDDDALELHRLDDDGGPVVDLERAAA